MRNFERAFIIGYLTLTITEILAEISGNALLVYLTKPALVISLGCLYVVKTKKEDPETKILYLTALFFAICGDIFLMIRGNDLFIPGLASFLIMQWLYIVVFLRQSKKLFPTHQFISLLPFLLYAAIFFLFVYPEDPVLCVAVGIYAASISVMAWTAFLRKNYATKQSFYLVFSGAMLFVASDSLIAIGRFVNPIPSQDFWVIGTYASAQLLITLGVIKTNQAD